MQVLYSYSQRVSAFWTRSRRDIVSGPCGVCKLTSSLHMSPHRIGSPSVIHTLNKMTKVICLFSFPVIMQTKLLLCHQFSLPRAYD